MAFLSGCRRHPNDDVLRYLQLVVALGERDPDAIDYYYGPDAWVSGARAHPLSLAEIHSGALDLASGIKTNGFLVRQLNAIALRAELLQGRKYSFDHEGQVFFNLEAPASGDSAELETIRQQIAALLRGKRYADFDAQFIIPEDRLRAVMERALQGCRQRTLQYLKLPPDESVSTEYVGDRPWNAYSSYKGRFHSIIRINTDFALTVDRALQLACHEGYPGHHAYNTLVDAQLVRRERRFELMVQPTFSPQSLSSEALATNAVDVAFPGEDRLRFEQDVLFPIAGINTEDIDLYLRVNRLVDQLDGAEIEIARSYIDNKLEWARAAAALEEKALMLHTDATLKYLNEYRTYMLTYTIGKDMVGHCISGLSEEDRWRMYERLILGQVDIKQCTG
jgi:hypothetical protein